VLCWLDWLTTAKTGHTVSKENMFSLQAIRAWLFSRRLKPLDELLAVEFDNACIKVLVLDRLDPAWNQEFVWTDITRVCFKDEGLYTSDSIIVELKGRARPVVVPTEAKGGSEFFGALTGRGYLPEEVWRRATGEANGAIHCWPPLESKEG
jgi:hypothetical protein